MNPYPLHPGEPAARLAFVARAFVLALLLATLLPHAAQAQEAVPPGSGDGQAVAAPVFLSPVENVYSGVLGDRIGFANGCLRLDSYPSVSGLHAGWYLDWWSRPDPWRPRGIEYAQMVRLHQNLTCPIGTTPDRNVCPYARPYTYSVDPPLESIARNARALPGSLWLVGNEIDRRDWPGGHQDEMLPEVYAVAYHEIYTVIKQADPTALVAIGGMTEMTELRQRYLDKVWSTYRQRYGADMPVDVWNMHNFVSPEMCRSERVGGRQQLVCYNMGVPPGETVLSGAYIGEDWRHIDHEAFDRQVRHMRQWMKDHGQMDKPLIVTEYGVLTAHDVRCPHPADADPRLRDSAQDCYAAHPSGVVPLTDANYVHDFMLWTFDYFLHTKDCSLSGTDGCRLVQRWAWFSLDSAGGGFNPHGQLFDVATREMTAAGRKFGAWALANQHALEYAWPGRE